MKWDKFNNIFKIDNIPLGYFIERLMVSGSVIRTFKTFKLIGDGKRRQHLFLYRMILFTLKKAFLINENLKIKLCKKRSYNRKYDVLFLAFTNQIFRRDNNLEYLGFTEVVRELKRRKKHPIVLVVDPISKNSFFGLKEYKNVLYNYVDKEIIQESHKIACKLSEQWKNFDEKEKIQLFEIQNKVWPQIKNKIEFLMSREILEVIVRNYLTFKRIIQNYGISVVYVTSLNGFYQLPLIAAAAKLDRAILYAPHGGGHIKMRLAKEFVKNIVVTTWGESDKKHAIGINKNKIFVTGSPFLDKIPKYISKKHAPKKKTILLLTKAVYETPAIDKKKYFEYVRKFLQKMVEIKDVERIIIKLHPIESGKYFQDYKKIVQELGLNIEINQQPEKEALYSLISKSDLVISYGSAADIEGLMLGKNVINIEGLGVTTTYKDAVYCIKKEDDLKSAVERVLYDKKTQKEIKRKREKFVQTLAKIDGKAYKRVTDLIISQINKRVQKPAK